MITNMMQESTAYRYSSPNQGLHFSKFTSRPDKVHYNLMIVTFVISSPECLLRVLLSHLWTSLMSTTTCIIMEK